MYVIILEYEKIVPKKVFKHGELTTEDTELFSRSNHGVFFTGNTENNLKTLCTLRENNSVSSVFKLLIFSVFHWTHSCCFFKKPTKIR